MKKPKVKKSIPVLRISVLYEGRSMDLLHVPMRHIELMISATGKTFEPSIWNSHAAPTEAPGDH